MRYPKNNIRSFRFSNEVAKILEAHNFDLEALVLECYYRLPQIQEQSVRIENYNDHLLEVRDKLIDDIENLRSLKVKLQTAEGALDNFIAMLQHKNSYVALKMCYMQSLNLPLFAKEKTYCLIPSRGTSDTGKALASFLR